MEDLVLGWPILLGVIAISMTAGTALGMVAHRMKAHASVRQGFAALEVLRRESRHAPIQALAAASQLMASFHSRLVGGRLGQLEHELLSDRAAALMHKIVAVQLQGPLRGASKDFKELVWAVLEDSVVSAAEAAVIRRVALREPYMSQEEVVQIDAVLDAWQGMAPEADDAPLTPAEATLRHAVA